MLQRQTNFSLEEIINYLRGGKFVRLPRCLLINELGAIVVNGEDQNHEGERLLIELLNSPHEAERATSYALLSWCSWLAEKHAHTLGLFRDNNKEIMPRIEAMVAKAR